MRPSLRLSEEQFPPSRDAHPPEANDPNYRETYFGQTGLSHGGWKFLAKISQSSRVGV